MTASGQRDAAPGKLTRMASDPVTPLVLYGAGGLGREVALMIRAINARAPRWELLGFLDDGRGGTNLDLPILGGGEALGRLAAEREPLAVTLCVGHSGHLATLAARARAAAPGIELPNLVHPDATCALEALEIGEGNLIAAGARLANVALGSFNVVNMNTVLGHDVRIGDRTLINPGAVVNGEVVIGSAVTVGAGATLLPRITVGDGATVAAGAVVGRPVEPGDTVAGNPARVVRRAAPRGGAP